MNRFHGKVGYGESRLTATGTGVYKDQITEYPYYGDVIRNTRRLEPGEGLNSNISVGNSISIVADQYANEHFFNIRYVWWMGTAWVVDNVEVRAPRLILYLGEMYNGPFPEES